MALNISRLLIDFSQTFMIILQETGKVYTVYTEPFCAESLFFRRSLEAGFKESLTKEIIISEEKDEQSMQVLVAWVYYGKEVLRREDKPSNTTAFFNLDHLQLAKLYFLADKFLMFNLKNDIMDQCQRLSNGHRMELNMVELVMANGPSDCQLKRFVADDIAAQCRIDGRRKNNNTEELFHSETSDPWHISLWSMVEQNHDLCLMMLQSSICPSDKSLVKTVVCKYHEHPDGFESCSIVLGKG